jgi:TRAP-type C4-dicarboxylate transport system permease large subunit
MTAEERIEGQLAGIDHRLAAIEGRLAHLQTVGTWLFAGLLASYAATFGAYGAILVVALRTAH